MCAFMHNTCHQSRLRWDFTPAILAHFPHTCFPTQTELVDAEAEQCLANPLTPRATCTAASGGCNFAYATAGLPVLHAVSPAVALPGDLLHVSGSGLTSDTQVMLGQTPCLQSANEQGTRCASALRSVPQAMADCFQIDVVARIPLRPPPPPSPVSSPPGLAASRPR